MLVRLMRFFFGVLIIFNWYNYLNKCVIDIDRYLYYLGVLILLDSRLE